MRVRVAGMSLSLACVGGRAKTKYLKIYRLHLKSRETIILPHLDIISQLFRTFYLRLPIKISTATFSWWKRRINPLRLCLLKARSAGNKNNKPQVVISGSLASDSWGRSLTASNGGALGVVCLKGNIFQLWSWSTFPCTTYYTVSKNEVICN